MELILTIANQQIKNKKTMKITKFSPTNFRCEVEAPALFNSTFDNFFNIPWKFWDDFEEDFSTKNTITPRMDVKETEKSYDIHFAVPGLKKEDIKINLEDDGTLTVSGERKFNKEEKTDRYHRVETQYGSFSRILRLPVDVKKDSIHAKYENGILELNLEKEKSKKEIKQIEVK